MLNAYYDSDEDYLDAIAREMRRSTKPVVDAGYVLQVDAPDLAMERVLLYQDLTDAEFAERSRKHVEALNKAPARYYRRTASGCMFAGAIGKDRTTTTWRWR